ncbi:PspC domain-containing protein [Palaeococcus sp. (in: euryarchaeotes)]
MSKRLYRSRNNKIFLGVLGGIAEYMEVDPTIVRIIYILLCLAHGAFILLYFLMAIVMPEAPEEDVNLERLPEKVDRIIEEVDKAVDKITKKDMERVKTEVMQVKERNDTRFFAVVLILLGLAMIAGRVMPFMFSFGIKESAALVLVLFGIYLLARG